MAIRRRSPYFPASGDISSIPRMGSDFAQMAQGVYINPNYHTTGKGAAALPSALLSQLLTAPQPTGPVDIVNPFVNQETGEAVSPTPEQAAQIAASMAWADAPTNVPIRLNDGLSVQQGPSLGLPTVNYREQQRRDSLANRQAEAMLAEVNKAAMKQRFSAEAAQRANLEKWARGPSVTEAQRDEAWQQHAQQFPEIVAALGEGPPSTLEEQIAEAQAAELAEMQARLPGIPLIRDAKTNEIKVVPGYSEVRMANAQEYRAKLDADNARQKSIDREYRFENEQLKQAAPREPDVSSPTYVDDLKRFNDYHRDLPAKSRAIYEKFYGPQQSPAPAPNPAATIPAPTLPRVYEDGAQAEAAFKHGRVKPGQPVVVGGVSVVFDEQGNARRAD